jgi:hypothetical protein
MQSRSKRILLQLKHKAAHVPLAVAALLRNNAMTAALGGVSIHCCSSNLG